VPVNWIVKGIPRNVAEGARGKRQIHKLSLPAPTEKGFYRQTSSMTWFRSGKLKSATAEDLRLGRDSCCWAPNMLWYWEREDEWERAQQRLARNPVLAKLDERVLPVTHHADIYAFFEHIGFDRRTRRYVAQPECPDIAGGTPA
jgi:hypothetical protein